MEGGLPEIEQSVIADLTVTSEVVGCNSSLAGQTEVAGRCVKCVQVCMLCTPAGLCVAGYSFLHSPSVS